MYFRMYRWKSEQFCPFQNAYKVQGGWYQKQVNPSRRVTPRQISYSKGEHVSLESRGTLGRGKGVFLGCFLKICAAIKDKRRETPTKEAGANEKKKMKTKQESGLWLWEKLTEKALWLNAELKDWKKYVQRVISHRQVQFNAQQLQ